MFSIEKPNHAAGPHPSPLPEYRERGKDDASRALRIGALIFAAGLALLFLPLLLNLRSLNKYIVAAGLIGVPVGLGCVTNGAIDALRARRR
jgi:hypothetical protein